MEQEVPLIVYTYQLNSALDLTAGCEAFYKTNFGFKAPAA